MSEDGISSQERLIEAAQSLLWERGYVGMSPRAIQDRAGVGQGSMYHHFRSKADLARAAEERAAAELLAEVGKVLGEPDTAGDALGKVIDYLRRERDVLKGCRIGRLTADPEVIADDSLRGPVEQALAAIAARLERLLRQAQEQGALVADADPALLARTVLAVIQGGYVLARSAQSPVPYQQAVDGLVALLSSLRRAATDR